MNLPEAAHESFVKGFGFSFGGLLAATGTMLDKIAELNTILGVVGGVLSLVSTSLGIYFVTLGIKIRRQETKDK
tara:strand:- start:1812 stop:2033 length:222 start_codon:yes stop_codon:yes gene_type:complete